MKFRQPRLRLTWSFRCTIPVLPHTRRILARRLSLLYHLGPFPLFSLTSFFNDLKTSPSRILGPLAPSALSSPGTPGCFASPAHSSHHPHNCFPSPRATTDLPRAITLTGYSRHPTDLEEEFRRLSPQPVYPYSLQSPTLHTIHLLVIFAARLHSG